ncbi:unnamed protein product [Coffea canephora]|uniref:AAA+ ATPase domain-containing protein n=1 Tax=Coffea canephora TaxID=49390 RepID=A0A068UPX1_COFCA|nr:unnamed protein product [Coffea canephora]
MAEVLLSASVDFIIHKLASVANENISLLSGFNDDLQRLGRSIPIIQSLLLDSERQPPEKEATKHWLKKLEEIAYDADTVLDELNYENLRQTDSISDANVRARQNEALEVVRVVTRPTNEVPSTYAIVGMAGIGKTTLARLIYNDSIIESHFDCRIWVFVGENFDVSRILCLILESLTEKKNEVQSRDALIKMVKRELQVKRYLLVLDDVWNESPSLWDDFIASLIGINPMSGNWIIVTTRSQQVASLVTSHPCLALEKLSDDDCWSILRYKACANGVVPSKEMETIGKKVAQKCQGLPFAASLVGGILRGKGVEEWHSIQESFSTFFNLLLKSSLFQDVKKDVYDNVTCCKMHDLVHEVLCKVSSSETKRMDKTALDDIPQWNYDWDFDNNIGGDVLEGLQPHPNLKILTVKNFMDEFPPWVRRIASLGFDNVVQIKFLGCKRCREIPSLGQLPNLQYLELNGFDSVTHIGPSFYFTNNHSESNSSGNDYHGRTLYPALKSLTIEDMPNLLEWMEARVMSTVTAADFQVAVFPNLKELTINRCPQLNSAPSHFPRLKQLSMSNIEKHIAENLSCCSPCLRKLEIINCEKLTMLPESLYSLQSLENLMISQCPNLTSLPSIHEEVEAFTSLRSLNILHCDGLTVVQSKILCHCKNLEYLEVSQCANLISFPVEELQQLGCLTILGIYRCPRLTSLPKGLGCLTKLRELWYGPFSDGVEFDAFQASLHGLEQLQSLYYVELCGWLHWNSLPYQLQHLTAMKELYILGFGVEALPDWFRYFRSLVYIGFFNCQKLQQLPPKEVMQCLTHLVDLTIDDCPLLGERCTRRSTTDSEFYKISNIERIYINQKKLEH